jgi:hypothetical protein
MSVDKKGIELRETIQLHMGKIAVAEATDTDKQQIIRQEANRMQIVHRSSTWRNESMMDLETACGKIEVRVVPCGAGAQQCGKEDEHALVWRAGVRGRWWHACMHACIAYLARAGGRHTVSRSLFAGVRHSTRTGIMVRTTSMSFVNELYIRFIRELFHAISLDVHQ